MGLQIRDDRQMKALTGLSQDQFDHLLSVFSAIYDSTRQKTYAAGVEAGTRRRKPGGGSKGKLPTIAEKLQFVLYYYKTYPTFDVLGTQFEMARSKAHENLHKFQRSGRRLKPWWVSSAKIRHSGKVQCFSAKESSYASPLA